MHLTTVEISLLLILLIFGIPMLLLIPPGAGYDEEDHLVRIWELSAFSFVPGQLPPQQLKYPTVFRDFAYRQQGSSGAIDAEFWEKYGRASIYEYGFVRRELDTKSVYSPALLFPQATAMLIFGRSADLSALLVFYMCRFASLFSYLILSLLAIRIIPFGKWILMVLAVSPMALFQAATIAPDAISNGIGFLFIAGILRTAEFKEMGWEETGSLVFLIFLLFLAKLNLIPFVLLLLLLITPSRFAQKRIYIVLLVTTLILFVVEVAGWNIIAATRSNPLLANEANSKAQLIFILGHPLTFLLILIKDLITNGWTYLQGWINGYGYYYWTPPQIVSFFFLLNLGAVLLIDSTREQVNKKLRVIFLFVFIASYIATIGSLYISFTPVGSDQVLGVQGRYFIPPVLLLFLILSSLSWERKISISSKGLMIFPVIALTLNVLGIYFSFYVPCGSTFYQIGLCYRPLYRDFTETRLSPPISNKLSLTQQIHVKCDGLTEVRVLLSPSISKDEGTTRFTLQDSINHQTLLNVSVANNQITAEDWYPLRFDPDWHSAGKKYVLKILSMNTSTGQGPQVLYTTQPEFNLGTLDENGQPISEDIVLQYGCVTGLRKLWLTDKP